MDRRDAGGFLWSQEEAVNAAAIFLSQLWLLIRCWNGCTFSGIGRGRRTESHIRFSSCPVKWPGNSAGTPPAKENARCRFRVDNFRVYLLSEKPLVIYTDHQALLTAFKKKYIHGRLASWLDLTAEYNFEVEYRQGSSNGAADYLSRRSIEAYSNEWDVKLTEGFVATVQWANHKRSDL